MVESSCETSRRCFSCSRIISKAAVSDAAFWRRRTVSRNSRFSWERENVFRALVGVSERRRSWNLIEYDIRMPFRMTIIIPHFNRGETMLLPSQLHYRCACSAFVLRRLGYLGYVRMRLQELAQRLAQDSHTAAVDDAHTWQSR